MGERGTGVNQEFISLPVIPPALGEGVLLKSEKKIFRLKGVRICQSFDQSTGINQGKRGKRMKKVILLGLALGLTVLGTAMESRAQSAPVLEKVWVSPEVNHGDLLKIYIKASDREGDMRWIMVSAGRGKGAIYGSVIRLRKENRKELNGYVFWDTGQAVQRSVSGTVEITIEDWKGNESETLSLPVKIVSIGAKSQPAPGEFKEKAIGPVMIDARDLGAPTP
jgi:hypothetical protein